MAIPISGGFQPIVSFFGRRRPNECSVRARLLFLAFLIGALAGGSRLFAAETNQTTAGTPQTSADFAARAKQNYLDARKRFQTETNSEVIWKFGRACFDWAEFAAKNSERAAIAEEGIAACRKLLAREPKSAAAHYYLALNLGQLAQTKMIGALKLVYDIEREFSATRAVDEEFDFAGADRGLGLLYLEAPSIGSVGSRIKSRQHLLRAARLAPDYPDNRLNLLEAFLKWNERQSAARELQAIQKLWPEMQKKFDGDAWALSWKDWERRLKSAQKKVQEQKPIESPRASE